MIGTFLFGVFFGLILGLVIAFVIWAEMRRAEARRQSGWPDET